MRGSNDRDIYLVFELMEANLFNVIRAHILTEIHIKYITYQILKALKYIHSADIMHRDLKPSHILINADSSIKIADFSLAKSTSILDEYSYKITDYMAMRWYRAPEILLSATNYDQSVDMWSIGCIIGEMINGKTLFPGSCTLNQITLILELTGRPNSEDIGKINFLTLGSIESSLAPGILDNVKVEKFKTFRTFFPSASNEALDLLEKLLVLNPKKRLSVDQALEHSYFKDCRNKVDEIVSSEKITFEISDEMREEINAYKQAMLKEAENRIQTRANTMRDN